MHDIAEYERIADLVSRVTPRDKLTLRNLAVIAALAQNDKLITNTEPFAVYMPTSVRGFLRFWYGESRQENINKIQACIRCAKNSVTTTLSECGDKALATTPFRVYVGNQEQMQFCVRMMDALRSCIRGLSNLKQTYRDDITTTCLLQSLVHEIEDFVHTTQCIVESTAFSRYRVLLQDNPE